MLQLRLPGNVGMRLWTSRTAGRGLGSTRGCGSQASGRIILWRSKRLSLRPARIDERNLSRLFRCSRHETRARCILVQKLFAYSCFIILIRSVLRSSVIKLQSFKCGEICMSVVDNLHRIREHYALTLDCAAIAAFTPIHVFSTSPSSFDMSELQSFMTSSAVLACRKLTMPAGRSIRAQIEPATTIRQSVSSVSFGGRSRRTFNRVSWMRV